MQERMFLRNAKARELASSFSDALQILSTREKLQIKEKFFSKESESKTKKALVLAALKQRCSQGCSQADFLVDF